MGLALRKQFPEFEIDEYTDEQSVTLAEAIDEVRRFDWANETLKSSTLIEQHANPSIRLRNSRNDILSIFWAEEDQFVVYFMERKVWRSSRTLIIKGYDHVFELIRLFDQGERDSLRSLLKAAEQHHKTFWLFDSMDYFVALKSRNSREVIQDEYVYTITFWKVFKKLIMSLGLIGATVVMGVIFSSSWIFFSFIFAVPAIPGIFLLINHYNKNKGWKIYFRKHDNTFIIAFPGGKEIFNKTDFVKRVVTINRTNAPWSDFEYNTLVRKDKMQLHISNLIVPTDDMDRLFDRIDTIIEERRFQSIKIKKVEVENKN
ncbi:MAG TPA: hypothetical protein PK325_07245 [Cyclobacteriaceae bacterium]|nr:hypothetical protein [Cyclobacteriaceae bacterium]HMV09391.1 hypothetical protein [Cyclobacteriaceae bacterium]HMV91487.1 hypothetical protein [Cyclobacteriaceae bacterium]HMX00960.1 hypothetical protein [Cyclobacteriaceae bacterium]HMX51100.1 hypothetical protein [Cyclobacteriaceae bacterium]